VWLPTTQAPGSIGTSDLANLAVTTAKLAADAATAAKIAPFAEGETLLFGCDCCGIVHGCDGAGTPYLSIAHAGRLCLESACIITAGNLAAGAIIGAACLLGSTCVEAKLLYASCCGILGLSDYAALPAGCLCTTKAELASSYYDAEVAFLKPSANCMYLMCIGASGSPTQLQVDWSGGVGLANLGDLVCAKCFCGECEMASTLICAVTLLANKIDGAEQLLVPDSQCAVARNLHWDGSDLMIYTGAAWVCLCQK